MAIGWQGILKPKVVIPSMLNLDKLGDNEALADGLVYACQAPVYFPQLIRGGRYRYRALFRIGIYVFSSIPSDCSSLLSLSKSKA